MKKIKKCFRVFLIICLLAVIAYSFIEPYRLEIKEYDIASSDIPESFDGAKIAFLTDIHYGDMIKPKWLEKKKRKEKK